jgi:hypothetical protein
MQVLQIIDSPCKDILLDNLTSSSWTTARLFTNPINSFQRSICAEKEIGDKIEGESRGTFAL